tara:strand:- start:45 stop:998 length:954 start_codon:yes stop_codon:yes gene_type:complete
MKFYPSNFIQKSKLLLSLLFVVLITFSCEEEDNCEEIKCEGAYTKHYAPVCGCNDVTYSNSSEAECKGITSYTEGKCKEDDDNEGCEETKCEGGWTKIYDPVCGCNDVTYSNSSEAECKGITSYTEGKCKKEDEPDCEEKECNGSYIEIYDPVCGCNGTTYENPSHALCHGITSYKKGECEKKSCNNIDILSSEPRDAELEKNMKKWQSFNICNYFIINLIGCNCTEEYSTSKTLKIKNGTLIYVDDNSYPSEELMNYKSINEMFEFINELYSMKTHILKVSYDEKYGFPTYLYVDYEEMMVDEEISYEFSKLTPFK